MERLNQPTIDKIQCITEKHKNTKGPVIVMLHDVQDELGYIPFEAVDMIAKATGVSAAEVYGVVNFYSGFTTQPKGKHIINVCLGTACYVKGAQELIDKAITLTKANINKTSEDGNFSLDATRCLGACGLAPVCVIDGKVLGNCTCDKLAQEIAKLQSKAPYEN